MTADNANVMMSTNLRAVGYRLEIIMGILEESGNQDKRRKIKPIIDRFMRDIEDEIIQKREQ